LKTHSFSADVAARVSSSPSEHFSSADKSEMALGKPAAQRFAARLIQQTLDANHGTPTAHNRSLKTIFLFRKLWAKRELPLALL
jgi:hypothetical protein